MAPAVVEKAAQAGAASKEFKKESATARLLGSGIGEYGQLWKGWLTDSGSSGIAELAIFHPVGLSLVATRLCKNLLYRRSIQ